jgi:hypothetical protein
MNCGDKPLFIRSLTGEIPGAKTDKIRRTEKGLMMRNPASQPGIGTIPQRHSLLEPSWGIGIRSEHLPSGTKIVADAHAVTDRASLRKVLSLRRGSRVVVALPSLATRESGELEIRLNRLVSECGCNMSAGALIAGMAACGLLDTAHWSGAVAHPFQTLGINLLGCFAAAALGRGAGLLRAKRKLARTIAAIAARLT